MIVFPPNNPSPLSQQKCPCEKKKKISNYSSVFVINKNRTKKMLRSTSLSLHSTASSSSAAAIKLLAKYNTLANKSVIAAFPSSSSFVDRKFNCLFFETPHATINHLAGVTELWLARIYNQPEIARKFHFLYNASAKTDGENWLELCPDFDKSVKWLNEMSEFAEEKVNQEISLMSSSLESNSASLLDDKIPLKKIRYFRTDGVQVEANAIDCFTHLFNHGTHHRGQIHASLCESGIKNCALDISYLIPGFTTTVF